MLFTPVTELTIVGVDECNVPNRERILIRPTEPVNLAQFGILIGNKNLNGGVTPLIDNFFWFGEIEVEPPCWIFVFTGKGQYKQTREPKTNHIIHSMHWGRHLTVFHMPSIVPVLFRMDAILIGDQLKKITRELEA